MDHDIIQQFEVPASIQVKPWMFDHCFEGAAVLPAVEIMQYMACAVQSHLPEATVTSMRCASFDRFLFIDAAGSDIPASCNLAVSENGAVRATLTTTAKVGSAGVVRMKEHATVCFTSVPRSNGELSCRPRSAVKYHCFEISARRLYDELVPFGPAFQSVQHNVTLTENLAVAEVCALDYPCAPGPLGSPFPLDGSLHAACAWAQRYCGIVAFPVGFDARLILRPVAPCERVTCTVVPVSVSEGAIRFDIWLHDQAGSLREMVKGIVMKDLSGGRMTPPAWVRSESPVRLA